MSTARSSLRRKEPLKVAIAAGGTGGHMMPAYALALELARRGHETVLFSDARGVDVPGIFRNQQPVLLECGRMTGGIAIRLRALYRVIGNIGAARRALRHHAPDLVIGFGGYPALSALLAARSLGIALCLHEQNAIMGRVNRLMARFASAIALSYEPTKRLKAAGRKKAVLTGNPVRDQVAALAQKPFPPLDTDHMLRLLVVGGSQGARVLSDRVPDALSLLPPHLKNRLQVTQQCRAEDLERVRGRYQEAGIAAELASFIEDLPERLFWCHLVISRAGATTLAELTAAGRPAILVPLPGATDDHQTANAHHLVEAGGAWLMPESALSAKMLARQIQKLALDPPSLRKAAAAAKSQGVPDAALRLADLIETTAAGKGEPHE
ncbi:UDP-N-acetylglucosamine--N-acetylmuramyl-(pentapeptide) pyrophosphoryl-undecaprenol N-acetylglucosamine transferase [alpha proteobacterium Q-1]|uniref:undecaprenyldiphospho-muramoylpentapeptide beta-N-acetylglucosaminyltransferase n=1 Tax=Iodidimonas nitroreducens TaxID=1236968 RepID=UPI0004A19DAF|nr:undecaprenyldiphospho-muramoylpentapeptide beta-N-acetylglucosaminyltransferase [Iodidimonas nitroreducens]GAK33756.1 UDP-N-acetylglucosamine--N-acetylmuramyl-(pentapeptide) pyrophosphoryl-undecaprenol N-acetylglucosamine transferase [alpha proteobacterium Q-1]